MRSTATVHWFRKGLRLHDNPALAAACADGARRVFPLFIIDPLFAAPERIGVLRYRFLLESLADLDASLQAQGSRLFVARGAPEEVLPRLWAEWGVRKMTYEYDTEPYAVVRDRRVGAAAAKAQVEVVSHVSHTLWDPRELMEAHSAALAPSTFRGFEKLAQRVGPVPLPLPAIGGVPPLDASQRAAYAASAFTVPTLEEMGYPVPAAASLFPGGERAALARMEAKLADTSWVCTFEKPKSSPNALSPSTTVLSPYLKFGCLSPRLFYHTTDGAYKRGRARKVAIPAQKQVTLHGQLLWREFYYLHGYATPHFGRMVGNPLCKQIPWLRPSPQSVAASASAGAGSSSAAAAAPPRNPFTLAKSGAGPAAARGSKHSKESDGDRARLLLDAWEGGRTGYPFIDAVMNQLRAEGWIHHLARHSVACFLTRGDLWISWEDGAAVFDKHLLDADWSLNRGNWMWLSASAFFSAYFRVYSPIEFGKKTDREGEYIRKYVPALRKMPAKYIYEPWKAPLAVQRAAGCVVGDGPGAHYPLPIVDHAEARVANLAKMKAAYAVAKEAKAGGKGGAKKRPAERAGGGAPSKQRRP